MNHSGNRRSLWLDPGFGASGDMILGCLIGLGAPIDVIESGLGALAIDGWTLEHETTLRCSLSADRALVAAAQDHHHRSWTTIDGLLAGAGLPDRVESGSRATFRRLGEVEAAIHRIDIDQVHFHEVGAVDAIVDIVGSWLALDALDVDHVTVGPVGLGHGSVGAAHGRLPVPAPATAELLAGAPVRPLDVEAETVTPTGAALLATMASGWGPIPAGVLVTSARGAGGRDPQDYPNVVSGYLIEPSASADQTGGIDQQRSVVISTNLDDVSPEIVGHTIARCLAAGADDAWATPVVMKKGRPGVELHVLSPPDRSEGLRQLVMAETGTLGLRTNTVTKHVSPRRFETVTVRGRSIEVKIGPHGFKPEYEDVAAAAEALELPVRQVSAEAVAAFLAARSTQRFANDPGPGQTR